MIYTLLLGILQHRYLKYISLFLTRPSIYPLDVVHEIYAHSGHLDYIWITLHILACTSDWPRQENELSELGLLVLVNRDSLLIFSHGPSEAHAIIWRDVQI